MAERLPKYLSEAVQTFREAQNLLPTLCAHLSALENIMTQNATLTGAVRRRTHCFASPTLSSFFLEEDTDDAQSLKGRASGSLTATACEREDAPAQLGDLSTHVDPRCTRSTTAVATAPLGVLVAFPASTSQHLIAQHQRDEGELLGVISRITQHSWPQKVEQLKAKVALAEASIGAASESRTGPVQSTLFLQTPAQLSVALYGLVACMIQMGSVLQEMMLAVRKDTRRALLSSSASSVGATVLADDLSSVLASEGRLNSEEAALLSMHELNNEKMEVQSVVGLGDGTNGAPPASLTLVAAVGMLEAFVKARWRYCRNVYLSEESEILLANM
ncbi:hypothetical protein ABL78_7594 [Leptomonas seymouri]|uniref:Uncharacterized protein n=1 Tax=Leptomonas seymouri TaxID=5684 RepID=A0A0N0P2U9_LEPSE|nr:hypothetical protein ABL78_7594 [Leptomonas seymouri]|eukprot:KPI83379.1 hypothetical protein ABL78_7594 [Leptomonas seymouri]